MSAMTTTVTTANDAATAAAASPRLIDLDTNRTIYLKKAIVFGEPGTGTQVYAEALKQMGLRVYDIFEAAKNFERDFPLWLEAAECKRAGKPYGAVEFDKLIGKYDAIVGAPAVYFAEELMKAYPHTKYIMLTNPPDPAAVFKYREYARSPVLSLIDPEFFGKLSAFLDIVHDHALDRDLVRSTVRPKNLLENGALDSWKVLCDFLDKPVIDDPVPVIHEDAAVTVFKNRCQDLTLRVGKDMCFFITCCAMAASVATAGLGYGCSILDTLGKNVTPATLMGMAVAGLAIARLIITRKEQKKLSIKSCADIIPVTVKKSTPPAVTSIPPHLRYKSPPSNSHRDDRRNNRANNGRQGRSQQTRNQQHNRGRRAPRNRNQSTSSADSAWSAVSSLTPSTTSTATSNESVAAQGFSPAGMSSTPPPFDIASTATPVVVPFANPVKRTSRTSSTSPPRLLNPTAASFVAPSMASTSAPNTKQSSAPPVITNSASTTIPTAGSASTPSIAKAVSSTAATLASNTKASGAPQRNSAWSNFHAQIKRNDYEVYEKAIADVEKFKDKKVEFKVEQKIRGYRAPARPCQN